MDIEKELKEIFLRSIIIANRGHIEENFKKINEIIKVFGSSTVGNNVNLDDEEKELKNIEHKLDTLTGMVKKLAADHDVKIKYDMADYVSSLKKEQENTGKIYIEKAIKKILSNNNVFLSLILKTFMVGAVICLAIYVLLRFIKWS